MRRRAGITFTAALLAFGLWALTAHSADDEDKEAIKQAQQDVIKLLDAMKNKKGDVKGQVQAIKKKYDELKPVMYVYKSRLKGGIGWGKEGSDIEQTIGKIGSRTGKLSPKKILDMREDIEKAAELSRAIAEVSDLYAEQYKEEGTKKNPTKWRDYNRKMREASDELSKAAKSDDVKEIKKAANNLKRELHRLPQFLPQRLTETLPDRFAPLAA